MHNLVDDAARKRLDGHFLVGRQSAEASSNAIDLCLANRFQVILQADDGRNNIERLKASVKLSDLVVDDELGPIGFLLAVSDVRADGLLEIVDIVDKDTVELVHLGIDVAGNGNIDEEHRPVAAAGEEL